MEDLFSGVYKNKTVLVSGHTGFKGSWLCLWLQKIGATVVGYSLEAPTSPSHIDLLNLNIISIIGDIGDLDKLNNVFQQYKPDIVFHLAAQSLVRPSYKNPIETYETNVIGTLKVFEACKNANVKAIVNVTSDKAYDNKEWVWGYREIDPVGGYDLYSSSKGCVEILTSSYRNSYFNKHEYGKTHNTLLASCRAGNVIGGGDWAKDRLMTDIMLSVSQGEVVSVRSPHATRPWQHVLEPLSGYLSIGERLLEGGVEFADAWNFGPLDEKGMTVEEVVKNVKKYWSKIDYKIKMDVNQPHEANFLKLDCSKACMELNWNSVWDNDVTFEKTISWYKEFYEKQGKIQTIQNLEDYVLDAKDKKIEWTIN